MGILKVGVLGAGIVGLHSAEQIKKRLPTTDVTIIADKFGVDTTSDGAAGLFMPNLYGFRGPTEDLTRQYIEDSYEYYSNYIHQNFGVREIEGLVLSNTTREDCHCKTLSTILPTYRDATEEELLRYSGNWKYGSYIKTLLIQVRNYMPLRLERLKEAGIKVKKRVVGSLSELEDEFDVIINCAGISAAILCSDFCLQPVRGQVLKARVPKLEEFILAGEDTYIIPYGHNISTLGGTHQFSYHNTTTNDHDTEGILQRCSKILPDLSRKDVLWEWAGLRPYRHTVRIEPELQNKLKVVHNYGHGGCGITTAPGTSKHAALLVEDLLKMSKL